MMSAPMLRRFVSIEGVHHFLRAKETTGGLCILGGHIGNWELAAYAFPTLIGHPMYILARSQRPRWFHRLLVKLRSRTGNTIIDKDTSFWKTAKLLNEGHTVAFLLDQKALPPFGIPVPFFHRKALTHKSLALLTYRTGAAVVPCFNLRQRDGSYLIKIMEPVDLPSEGSLEERVTLVTLRFNAILEHIIRQDPLQWYWIHRRFTGSLPR